jgi:hypothetical protein
MSSPNELADKSKPVLKEKNPHNYRKVGFSMIVISVSLVLIGLLVWSIGSDYHFASNIMAGQELTAMTPKAGYQIVLFDYTQPIGAKLKLLDHADSLDKAQELQNQYQQQNTDATGQILIFGTSESDNLNLMANAEVAAMTPKQGYNVILFNTALPVGAKLTMGKHDSSLDNATQYEQQQVDLIKDPDVKVVIFTSSFTDNLKIVTGSSTPAEAFATLANNSTSITLKTPQTAVNQTATITSSGTATAQSTTILSNQTNTSTAKANLNTTSSKSITLDEKVGLNTTTSNK